MDGDGNEEMGGLLSLGCELANMCMSELVNSLCEKKKSIVLTNFKIKFTKMIT